MPAIVKMFIRENKLVSLSLFLSMLPEHIRKETQKRLWNLLGSVVELAKGIVRVDTGSTQRSIRRMTYAHPSGMFHKMGVRAGGFIVNPKTGRPVDYAVHLEHRYPFMRPAWETREGLLDQVLLEGIRAAIRENAPS